MSLLVVYFYLKRTDHKENFVEVQNSQCRDVVKSQKVEKIYYGEISQKNSENKDEFLLDLSLLYEKELALYIINSVKRGEKNKALEFIKNNGAYAS